MPYYPPPPPGFSAERVVFYNTSKHANLQAAVNEASLLAGADISDPQGVAVFIPAGFFDETVVINKSIALVGSGRFATKVTRVDFRPAGTAAGQTLFYGNVIGLTITTLKVKNETADASGVFNTNGFMQKFTGQDVAIDSWNFSGCSNVYIFASENGSESFIYNCQICQVDQCLLFGKLSISGSDADTNTPQTSCNVYSDVSYVQEVEVTRTGGTEKPVYKQWNSYCGLMTANDNTTVAAFGGVVAARILNGSPTIDGWQSETPYTPTTSGDWNTTSPISANTALDDLASRSGTNLGASGASVFKQRTAATKFWEFRKIVQGTGLTVTENTNDITLALASQRGVATIDFGAFPGKTDTSLAVTGQTAIVAGSVVDAWIRPVATAEHSADEHLVETIRVIAGNIVAGTGFTIYANSNPGTHRLYGQWTVAWEWN